MYVSFKFDSEQSLDISSLQALNTAAIQLPLLTYPGMGKAAGYSWSHFKYISKAEF